MIVNFHPGARSEFLDAITYYEDCEPGLGADFALEVRTAIDNAREYPMAWPILEDEIRRCLTNRFPYGVIYALEPDGIHVLAIMHLHRHPDCWKGRE